MSDTAKTRLPLGEESHASPVDDIRRAYEQMGMLPDVWLMTAAEAARHQCAYLAESVEGRAVELPLFWLGWVTEQISDAMRALGVTLTGIQGVIQTCYPLHDEDTKHALNEMETKLELSRNLMEPAAHLLVLGASELPTDTQTTLRPHRAKAHETRPKNGQDGEKTSLDQSELPTGTAAPPALPE